jgi:hypothetical protein
MKQLISPFTNYRDLDNIENLNSNNVLHICDVFDNEYLEWVYATKGKPAYVVSDHFFKFEDCYCVPLYIDSFAPKFLSVTPMPIDIETNYCFNFLIRKKNINRGVCIKLIEYFQLTDFDYTFKKEEAVYDMSKIIKEMNSLGTACPVPRDRRFDILGPINLSGKFTPFSKAPPGEDWIYAWKEVLYDIVSKSAVSLITESHQFQKGSLFTEKTLQSALGLTFPIWIGGYQQAKAWQAMGFDTFDDLINHDYQNFDTLFERCYYAIELNLRLLTDRNYVAKLRKEHLPRLIKNRQLLIDDHLGTFIDKTIKTWPLDLQEVMPKIVEHYGKNKRQLTR